MEERLGRSALLELLRDDVAAGDAFLRDHLARSHGEEATGTTVLRAHGISAQRFGACSAGPSRAMTLGDGTVVGSIANAFAEEADGFTARLSVTLPATCDFEVVEQHLERFAVEFRTWILRAAAESGGA